MSYNAWFQCINGCPGQYSLLEVIYRCPTCGDLLEVQHDIEALRSRSAAAWIQLFDDRYRRNIYPYGSGVWGKKEWVMPFLDNENVVSMYEGTSNLLWADRYGKQLHLDDLWVKQCGNSHTGSFKDLGMTVLVSVVKQMMAQGAPIDAVACASAPTARRLGSRPWSSCRGTGSRLRSSCNLWLMGPSCSRWTPTSTGAWPSCRRSLGSGGSTSPTR